ncbi:MAG: hypothetical protein WB780_05120 [Candidatus Acidiferrales bacterium]
MNSTRILRISIVVLGLGLASLTARPCRAQAEISPDHYDEMPAMQSAATQTASAQIGADVMHAAVAQSATCAAEQGSRGRCEVIVRTARVSRPKAAGAKPKPVQESSTGRAPA